MARKERYYKVWPCGCFAGEVNNSNVSMSAGPSSVYCQLCDEHDRGEEFRPMGWESIEDFQKSRGLGSDYVWMSESALSEKKLAEFAPSKRERTNVR